MTPSTDRSWCLVVPHHPQGARSARRRIVTELGPVVGPALLADVVAVVAELVGNAVRHAEPLPGSVIRVAWRLRSTPTVDEVQLRVTDGGGRLPPCPRVVGPESTDGRGLNIVAALSVAWGVDRDGLGQSVWARVAGAHPDALADSSARPSSPTVAKASSGPVVASSSPTVAKASSGPVVASSGPTVVSSGGTGRTS